MLDLLPPFPMLDMVASLTRNAFVTYLANFLLGKFDKIQRLCQINNNVI